MIRFKLIFPLFFILYTFKVYSQGKDVWYNNDTTKLKGFYAQPAKSRASKKPSVIVIHAWNGITDHEKNTVNQLAELGYKSLAADIYGENVRPATQKEAAATSGYYKKNPGVLHGRIKAAIAELVKQGADEKNIIVMGYCFGGTAAIEAGRAGLPVKGIVTFHGGLGKDSLRPDVPIHARVLVLHGADDPFVPEKDIKKFIKELRAGKTDWQMIYYSNAVHSFSNPGAGDNNNTGNAYNKEAAERSWKAMVTFLEEF